MKTRSSIRQAPLTALWIFFLLVMLFPVYWMINTSLQSGPAAVSATFVPLHPTFLAYSEAISTQLTNIGTSLMVALGTVIVSLAIATPAAYALAKLRFRWVGVVLLALLISQMVTSIVIANALYSTYNDVGLLNTIPG